MKPIFLITRSSEHTTTPVSDLNTTSCDNEEVFQEPLPDHLLNQGPWSPEESDLFLDAQRRFGKDWQAITMHVRTRKDTNVRAHAQKVHHRIKRLLNNRDNHSPEEVAKAEFYDSVLNSKMNKRFSRPHMYKKKMEKERLWQQQ